jgi:hypothetical protein
LTASKKPNPATPARPWAWPILPKCCGTATCATIRPTRIGPNRDRFVLSNGHGSMLIYALLHLTGYNLAMEELKKFRQLHSKTAGHPEFGITPGVETTTGPLGQGITNAVGMALAEKLLAAEFNREEGGQPPSSTTSPTCFPGRWLHDGGYQPRSLRWRARCACPSWWRSTTTTAFPSTAMWKAGSPTTRPSALRPMAGT